MFSFVGYVVFAQPFSNAPETDSSPRQQVDRQVRVTVLQQNLICKTRQWASFVALWTS